VNRRDFLSSRFQYTFGPHAPTLTVEPPASLCVICPDSDNALADGNLLSARQRQPDVPVHLQGNPLAGAIFVVGAKPGNCVAIRIERVELDRDYGQTGLAPGRGLLDSTGAPEHLYRWKLDHDSGRATLANPLGDARVSVPLDPFVGCIGVCPTGEPVRTVFSGPFGGNLDLPIIRPGATVYLPVFREGGLVLLGDVHAAQGDGEIIGGAIETSGRIHCTIDLLHDPPTHTVRVRDDTHLAAIAAEFDLHASVRRAYADLLEWVNREFEMNRWDTYNLISQTGSVVLGNMLAAPYPVAARVPLAVLPGGQP
jgi:amidase